MNVLDQLGRWVSENESLFSGLAAIVALVAIIPAAMRPMLRRRRAEEASRAKAPARKGEEARPSATPRLAVMPFDAGSDDDRLLSIADIVTGELTALLARSRGCQVISARSASAFAQRGGTTADALEQLEVQYTVEGRVRSDGDRARVSASLVDTRQDRVLWSQDFHTDGDDGGTLPRTVAEHVATHLGLELSRAEVGRSRQRPRSRAARDLVLGAHGVLFDEGHSRASYRQAIELLERAIAADPDDAEAHGLVALLTALGNIFGFVERGSASRDRAMEACRKALELDDRSSEVLGYAGCAYCDLRQPEKGIPLLERAIEVNPSNAQAKAALGTALIGERRVQEGVDALEDALRITPVHKGIAPWFTILTQGYLQLGRLDDAAASIERSLRCDPDFFPTHLAAAALAVLRGDRPGAERFLHEARRLHPEIDLAALERIMGSGSSLLADLGQEPA